MNLETLLLNKVNGDNQAPPERSRRPELARVWILALVPSCGELGDCKCSTFLKCSISSMEAARGEIKTCFESSRGALWHILRVSRWCSSGAKSLMERDKKKGSRILWKASKRQMQWYPYCLTWRSINANRTFKWYITVNRWKCGGGKSSCLHILIYENNMSP